MKELIDMGAAAFAVFSAVVLAGPALAAMAVGPLSAEVKEEAEAELAETDGFLAQEGQV